MCAKEATINPSQYHLNLTLDDLDAHPYASIAIDKIINKHTK